MVNLSSGKNYTIEYDAMDEVLNATLPFVETGPNGTVNLTWYDGGGICVAPVLNETYYSQGFQYVTTVNGSVFNDFLRWTVQDNATYNEYELFYAMHRWEGPINSTRYLNSSTCYDFNWRGMDFLYKAGANISYTEPMYHDYIATISDPLVEVDYNDPYWKKQIDQFYISLHLNLHSSWEQWLLFLTELLVGHKFLHAHQRYYLMPNMHHPYIAKHYSQAPLPGQPGF